MSSGASGNPPARVRLRPIEPGDLPTLFQQQLDPESNQMAGTKPRSPEAFRAAWERNFGDPSVVARAILRDDVMVGAISCFRKDGVDSVGYWIAREHWGGGIATQALMLLLGEVKARPLHATAARANAASIRVLEKCGFRLTGYHAENETDRYLAGEVATFVIE